MSTISPAMQSENATRAGYGTRLTSLQVKGAAVIGVILWISVALIFRYSPAVLFDRGPWTVAVFVSCIPNAYLTNWLATKLLGVKPGQILPAMGIGSAAAMFCDGLSLTWTTLYGPETKDLVPVAATLLWGVSMILAVGYFMDRRAVA